MDNSSPVSWSCQRSRQSLEICEGHAIADRAVLISGVCLDRSILGVHNFQNRRFATRVTKHGEPQAIFRKFGGTIEVGKFVQRRVRFGIQRSNLGKKFALRQRKLPLGLAQRKLLAEIRSLYAEADTALRGINAIPI